MHRETASIGECAWRSGDGNQGRNRRSVRALVMINSSGNGGYSVAGLLEAQLPMPDVMEQVASALRTQLAGSVH